jgi:hypothetical protein
MTTARTGIGTVEDPTSCKQAILSGWPLRRRWRGAKQVVLCAPSAEFGLSSALLALCFIGGACDIRLSWRTRYLATGVAAGIWLLRVAVPGARRGGGIFGIDHKLARADRLRAAFPDPPARSGVIDVAVRFVSCRMFQGCEGGGGSPRVRGVLPIRIARGQNLLRSCPI